MFDSGRVEKRLLTYVYTVTVFVIFLVSYIAVPDSAHFGAEDTSIDCSGSLASVCINII